MIASRGRRSRFVYASIPVFALALTAGMGLSWGANADKHRSAVPHSAATDTAAPRTARPHWVQLSPAQREALAPLAGEWENLDSQHKKKWVEIAGRYPKMKPEEKQHAQDRMREWAVLTPEERRVARDSFVRVQALPPEKRAEMLEKYRELSPEKKKALAAESQATKALITTKTAIRHSSRRKQIREGAKTLNPAVAVQKGLAAQKARHAPHAPAAQPAKPAPANSASPAAPPAVVPAATPNVIKPPPSDGGAARP